MGNNQGKETEDLKDDEKRGNKKSEKRKTMEFVLSHNLDRL